MGLTARGRDLGKDRLPSCLRREASWPKERSPAPPESASPKASPPLPYSLPCLLGDGALPHPLLHKNPRRLDFAYVRGFRSILSTLCFSSAEWAGEHFCPNMSGSEVKWVDWGPHRARRPCRDHTLSECFSLQSRKVIVMQLVCVDGPAITRARAVQVVPATLCPPEWIQCADKLIFLQDKMLVQVFYLKISIT